MINKAPQIVEAALAIKEHLGAGECVIALKCTYTKEIAALRQAIKGINGDIYIKEMESFYPAGDEQVIVYEVTGRVVPPAGIPLDVGCVVSNIATVYSVYNAMQGHPFIKKYLTITGEVNKPSIICAPIGTPFTECLELACGAKSSDFYVINGGPMMGKLLTKGEAENAVVTKTTSGLILLPEGSRLPLEHSIKLEHTINRAKSACIQCSFCTQLCPRHMLGHPIEPHRIMRRLAGNMDLSSMLDDEVIRSALICCECGACEIYACPMGLQPRRVNVEIKKLLAEKGIKYSKGEGEFKADSERENRKLPTKRVAGRAGVGCYYDIEINSFVNAEPVEVRIPLRQHIGAPSEPVVSEGCYVRAGDLIAKCPEDKLGANIHASIDGKVTQIGSSIVIRRGE